MSWRTDLIAGMTGHEAKTLLAMIAGGQPDTLDWAADALGGTLAERFAQARAGQAVTPRCRTCGGLLAAPHTDPHDGKAPRWHHLVLPGGGGGELARFLDGEHSGEPEPGEAA